MFERTDGAWGEVGTIWPPDAEEGDEFGRFLDYDGSRAVLSNFPDDNENGTNAGSVWVQDFACVDGCGADFDGNGIVDTRDFIVFLAAWAAGDWLADFNADGEVDTRDFIAFLGAWAAGCR